MPEEAKDKNKETPEETAKPAKKSKGPLMFIIISAVVFIIAIGAFSVVMGVFSSEEKPEEVSQPDEKQAVVEEKQPSEDTDSAELSDIEELEQQLFDIENIEDAEDMDDLVKLAEEDEHSQSGMSKKDSIEAADWLATEKAKLAKERAELEALKKERDAQEYKLKQLIAKTDQMESARINALAKLYDGMKPSQVAPLINKLTDEQAVEVLLKMKSANAAKILGVLKPDRAAHISSKMITLTKE